MCIFELRSALHSRWPTRFDRSEIVLFTAKSTPPTQESRNAADRAELRLTAPAALNIPVVFIGLARSELVPGAVQREIWFSLTWPLAGLVFWWIAGRAIDALRAARTRVIAPQINPVETLVGLLLFAFFGVLAVGIIVDPSIRAESTLPWRLELAGSVMWIALAASTISARIAQWRINTRIEAETVDRTISAQRE